MMVTKFLQPLEILNNDKQFSTNEGCQNGSYGIEDTAFQTNFTETGRTGDDLS